MSKTTFIAKTNIYRSVDGEIIFGDGNPSAAFHVARAGSQVPEEWAKQVKAASGDQPDEPEAVPEPADVADVESAEPTPDGAVADAPVVEPPAPPAKPAPVKKAAKKVTTKVVKKAANK